MTADTILLAPDEGDPYGLLRGGRGGSRAPLMVLAYAGTVAVGPLAGADVQRWQEREWAHDPTAWPECPRALVLGYDGDKVHPDGQDRLRRAGHDAPDCSMDAWFTLSEVGLPFHRLLSLATSGALDWAGRVALLDAEGREVPR